MTKQLSLLLGLSILSTPLIAATLEFSSHTFEFNPGTSSVITNPLNHKLKTTCTLNTKEEDAKLFMLVLKNGLTINGYYFPEGDSDLLRIKNSFKLDINAEANVKVEFTNQSASLIRMTCTY